MRAIRYHRYGGPDVLELEDVDPPTVGDDDVLIRVRAAAVNPYDWHFMRGIPYVARAVFGFRGPRNPRLGVDVAGVVEAVGAEVTALAAGDEVFGQCTGAFAELATTTQGRLVHKPANVSFEQAAATPVASLTAVQGLRDDGRIEPGHRVLVNGASGGVGTFAVQIAKVFGAEVTAVSSAANLDLLATIGADHLIDYAHEDFTAGQPRYDVVFDTIGNHSLNASRRVVVRGGRYLMVGGPTGKWIEPVDRMLRLRAMSPFVPQRLVSVHARWNADDMNLVRELLVDDVVVPVIDRTYPLAEVPEAIRYLETGHARGKVVITV